MSFVTENIEAANQNIADSASKAGRTAADIDLLVVSKRVPLELIRDAVAAGQRRFGENKVQEAVEKIPLLPSNLDWHFIGRLQHNKIRKILGLVSTVHSINSLDTALTVDRIAGELGVFPSVYIQVNISQEASKQGFSSDALDREIEQIATLSNLQLIGLMTMPPFSKDPEEARPHFAALRLLRDRLEQTHQLQLPGLSMGMSHDYPIAIEEGSTVVRLGTSIFTPRSNVDA